MIYYAILITLILLLLCIIGASLYFYSISIQRKKKVSSERDDSTSEDSWIKSKVWLKDKPIERVVLKSFDGLNLIGYYLEAKQPTNKTAIIVHGYTSNGKSMAAFGKIYFEQFGYNILMPDLRGHGESEGNYIGFGWHDRKDIISWINYALTRNGSDSKIVLHGISMGGGTVLMTSGEELPSNVKCIISDCAYSSIKDILAYQMKTTYKLPSFPILNITSIICKFKAGYFFKDGSAIEQVKRSKTPILYIHGDADTFVPTSMVYALNEATKAEKDLLIVKGAEHGNAYWVNTITYETKVKDFINKFA